MRYTSESVKFALARGVDCFPVMTPEWVRPIVVLCFFLGQIVYGARFPVENRNINSRGRFRLVIQREPGAIRRPHGRRLGNIRSESEISDFSSFARNRIEIVDFASALVRFEDDPLAVRRPYRIGLPVVGLAELNRPAAGGVHFPEVIAAGDVRRESDLLAVGRPGWAYDSAGIE